ncbi:hypothetical protein BJX64DRAFT_239718 [Aspergillus heterothallicus]
MCRSGKIHGKFSPSLKQGPIMSAQESSIFLIWFFFYPSQFSSPWFSGSRISNLRFKAGQVECKVDKLEQRSPEHQISTSHARIQFRKDAWLFPAQCLQHSTGSEEIEILRTRIPYGRDWPVKIHRRFCDLSLPRIGGSWLHKKPTSRNKMIIDTSMYIAKQYTPHAWSSPAS